MIYTALTAASLVESDPWLIPYQGKVQQRIDHTSAMRQRIIGSQTLSEFALGHIYFGLHKHPDSWVFREWAPNATKIYLVGEWCNWQDDEQSALTQTDNGVWEVTLPDSALKHGDRYKLHMYWDGGDDYRIPAWATYVVQDMKTLHFDAQVWAPAVPYQWNDQSFTPPPEPLRIYEAHIGMSSESPHVSTYTEFQEQVLPRIIAAGYTTIQLMAIAEHPYYGSFGYHVSNFFAPSSRFGTPDELKALIDAFHKTGIAVIMDLVHSHAVKNESEGLGRFDGTTSQYFHAGVRGQHSAWDSRVFDYAKPEVAHFLLSNCRYWLEEFHLDGFRFDGVTSMLYLDHGLEKEFTSYDDYFNDQQDLDASAYLTLANDLIHELRPSAITIAEDTSGTPGIAAPTSGGGIGFNYRLSMGVPDLWIKTIKEKTDETWNVGELFHELSQHRPEEKTISYAESHDQALVGDKTLIFRLIDKEMYEHMAIDDANLQVDRGIALHKMIRLLTASMHHGGYLNFMGNEFGHPEWIDFPREGNDWSYHYARRQWSLADDPKLKYGWLAAFDKAMVSLIATIQPDMTCDYVTINEADHVISFMRGDYLWVYNFHPTMSYTDYRVAAKNGDYYVELSSDDNKFGGTDRIDTSMTYGTYEDRLSLYLPARTATVFRWSSP